MVPIKEHDNSLENNNSASGSISLTPKPSYTKIVSSNADTFL